MFLLIIPTICFIFDIFISAWCGNSLVYITYTWFFSTALLKSTKLQRVMNLFSTLLITSFYDHHNQWVYLYIFCYALAAFYLRNIITSSIALCALCTFCSIGIILSLNSLHFFPAQWISTILITIGMVKYMYQQGNQGNRRRHANVF